MAAAVLDCSVALSWFMPDENEPGAVEFRTLVTDRGAVVPMLWPIEMGNAFTFATRNRRISAAHRTAALEALGQLPIEIDSETLTRIWTDTLNLADKFRLTVYDACYVELAQRRRLPLATLDKEMRAVAKRLGLSILG